MLKKLKSTEWAKYQGNSIVDIGGSRGRRQIKYIIKNRNLKYRMFIKEIQILMFIIRM